MTTRDCDQRNTEHGARTSAINAAQNIANESLLATLTQNIENETAINATLNIEK